MNEKIKRLLFTGEPYFDESFVGYVLRLAQMNDIPDPCWIFQLVKPNNNFATEFQYSFDFTVNTRALARLAGIAEDRLREMLYVHHSQNEYPNLYRLNIFGQSIPDNLVCRQKPKVCPPCLRDANYCRKVWEIAFVTVCPVHQCLLLDECPACRNKLRWKRPGVHRCRCGYDFCEFAPPSLEAGELRLTKYLYQIFSLPSGDPDFSLNYPLKTLSTEKLLKLLYFMLAYFANYYRYRGEEIVRYFDNELMHRFMTSAFGVFDNWAENYHEFIEAWKNAYEDSFDLRNLPYAPHFLLPLGYEDYENFNFVLREHFGKRDFPFLYREFVTFLKKLPTEEYFESYLLEYL